jgi:hypothetical protein
VVTFLFWNVHRKELGGLAASIAEEHRLDVILLAECANPARFLVSLNQPLSTKFNYHVINPERRIEIYSRFPNQNVQLLGDTGGLSAFRLLPFDQEELLVVGAHLWSKRNVTPEEQALLCTSNAWRIAEFERIVGHRRTILVGDLNMNPFETGVVGAQGFHAASSRAVAAVGSRTVGGEQYRFFYNPMWSHFGDRGPSPPGTYFYRSSAPANLFWNIFDQVLVRPELLGRLADENVKILTRAGEIELLLPNGQPNASIASDHLPIVFSIE